MSQDKFDLEEALKNLNSAPSSQKKTGTVKKKNAVKIEPDYRYEACNDSFPCANCGKMINPEGAGT
ncbi:MAG: GTP-binding protein EngC, partial [Lachnoanaerobaculum sp.]|nr:GTP-binding protein EngC [Lachnoanaerobaculum sp.]